MSKFPISKKSVEELKRHAWQQFNQAWEEKLKRVKEVQRLKLLLEAAELKANHAELRAQRAWGGFRAMQALDETPVQVNTKTKKGGR